MVDGLRAPAGGRQRGSSLLLVPAGVLILVVLGALAVDLSNVHLSQRELVAAAQAAVGDAAAASLHEATFYHRGEAVVAADAARAEVVAALAASDLDIALDSFGLSPDGEVVIRVSARVDTIFARAVPGGPDVVVVRATARAALAG